MDNRMPWFKWWVGTAADPKLRMLAEQVKVPVASVLGIWAYLLEHTKSTGKIRINADEAAALLGIERKAIEAIIGELERLGFICDGRVVNWNRRHASPGERLCEFLWAPIRKRIFERDNYTCRYCGAHRVRLECDHVMPLSRGGSNDDDNLATACRTCDRSKRDKTVEEWRAAA